MKTVCIIGGGASGTLLAYHLSHLLHARKQRIILIEKQHAIGRGLAYSTKHEEHLLNVPAHYMSALPDQKTDFIDWLKSNNAYTTDDDFMPRGLYGRYLSDLIHERCKSQLQSGKLQLVHAEAISCTSAENTKEKYVVECSDHRKIHATVIILAMGNFDPAPPNSASKLFLKWQQYYPNPWSEEFRLRVSPNTDGLIIGSGLTMVDVVNLVQSKGLQGTLYSVSTHGYLPQSHQKSNALQPGTVDWATTESFSKFMSQFISLRKKLIEEGNNWRAVVDSLRPHHQKLWLSWSITEKQTFLRHLRHIWGVMRHRMPPSNAESLKKLLDDKKLHIYAGKIESLDIIGNKISCVFYERKTGERKIIMADWAVNCTGPMSAPHKVNSLLLQQLSQVGWISSDEMSMGLASTPEGKVIDNQGQVNHDIFAVGPMIKGILWEITAMPEIRVQTQQIAELIAREWAEDSTTL